MQVSAASLFELPFYNPSASGARIACPTIIVAAVRDSICPLQVAEELQKLSPQVQLVPVTTCKFFVTAYTFDVAFEEYVLMLWDLAAHFELYGRQESLDAMVSFLAKHASLDG